jgi:hypothetical protein
MGAGAATAIIVAAVLVTVGLVYWAGVMDGSWPNKLKRKPKGKWSKHNCTLPNYKHMMPLEGSDWTCKCGRKWRYLRIKNYERIWEERTPEKELKEAEENLKKLGG